MADEITRGAVRIITDVHDERPKPGMRANTILRGEFEREIDVLVKSDLELARMLDQFDEKLQQMNGGLFEYAESQRALIGRIVVKLDALEARTLPARLHRMRRWIGDRVEDVEQWLVRLVFAIDTSTDPRPRSYDE